jgi:hypothetical protein
MLLLGLCLGVTGAWAQLFTVQITSTTVTRSGVATVSGTVTCAGDFALVFLDMEVDQPVGRTQSVTGFDSTSFSCAADETVSFTQEVFPFEGRFGPGTAYVRTSLFVDDPCCFRQDEATTVRLRRPK